MITLKQIVAPQFLTNTEATYYTSPAAATGSPAITSKISRAVFVNTTGGGVALTMGIVTSGSLTSATTLISITVPANQTYVSPELAGAVIPAGSILRGNAGSNNAIIIMVSGLTVQ